MLVPSRGRPDNVRRLAQAVRKTAPDVRILAGISNDDPCLPQYDEVEQEFADNMILLMFDTSPRPGMVERLNLLARTAEASNVPYIGFMGDDVVPQTVGWDTVLTSAVSANGGGIAYPADGVHAAEAQLPTSMVMDARMPRALGYIAPPTLHHLYVDNVWRDWGKALGKLHCYEYVLLEHMHPLVNKAPDDDNYREQGRLWRPDTNSYNHYIRTQLQTDVRKIREALQ